MNATTLRAVASDALEVWADARDELCALDSAIGDGDLGITVSSGARSVIAVWAELGDEALTPSVLLRTAAKAFGTANPSTMAAFVSGATLNASKAVDGVDDLDRQAWATVLEAAISLIERRGGAVRGDKTMLDAMWPAYEVVSDSTVPDADALGAMIAAAADGVTATQALQSQRGRAAWVGERSVGQPDPGATAFLRLLEAVQVASRRYSEMER